MSSVELCSNPLGSPLFNPSPRLRAMLGDTCGSSEEIARSSWSRIVERLLVPCETSPEGAADVGDIAPLWLIEPRDTGLRGRSGDLEAAKLAEHLRNMEGPWLQRLFPGDGTLHYLYVTAVHSASADGFYLPNGGLIIARPGERFRVSLTAFLVGDKPQHRLPSPIEVWRHRLFSRTVIAPSNGLCSGRDDLEGAVVTLAPERWGPLPPWPSTRARPGTALDQYALGLYSLMLVIVATLNVITMRLTGLLAAVGLLVVAACVMYGIRPALWAHQRTSNVFLDTGRWCTYFTVVLALTAQVALHPDSSFFWIYAVPIAALVAGGPRRAVPWLILLLLSAAQYGVVTWAH